MKYIKGFVWIAAGLMMLAVSLVFFNLYFTLDKREAALQKTVTTALAATGEKLNGTLNAKVEELRGDLNKQLHPVSRSAADALDGVRELLMLTRLKVADLDVQGVNRAVDGVTQTVATANTTVAQVGAAIKPLQSTLAQVDAALPDFLDCNADGAGNPNCVYNRYVGLAWDAEQTMRAVTAAAPATAKAVEGMAQDGKGVTGDVKRYVDKFTAPPTLWEKVQGVMETFGWIIVKAWI